MKAHTRGAHKPRSLDEVDVELEEALQDLRRYIDRCHTGRARLTAHGR
jgi:hypothetical protein